jgi:TPR repeat protein
LGVPKDFAEAYKWYELARAGGAPGTQIPHNATEAGDWIRLHHRYTADELEDGKKRLEKWRAEHGRLLRR